MLDTKLARLFPLLALSRQNLWRARTRTILAMAGITIGVVAIASLGMFGVALEQFFLQDASSFTQTVRIGPGEDAEFSALDERHVERIEGASSYEVIPITRGFANVSARQTTTGAEVIRLSDPRAFATLDRGSLPPIWRDGALVGATLAEDLDVEPGDQIVVDGERHRVRGVLEEVGQASMLGQDSAVLLPTEGGASETYDGAFIRAESPNAAFEEAERLREQLNPGRDERYAVQDASVAIEQFNQQLSTINTFLIGVGAVSLLVAAVSILNVMLMSTIERRGEIGLLRAVGYHRRDVLRLLLTEAALIGAIGAVVGVVLSVLLGMLINAELLGDPLAFTVEALQYTVIGFAFGTVASFLSGFYPAWKAANAPPVESLRD